MSKRHFKIANVCGRLCGIWSNFGVWKAFKVGSILKIFPTTVVAEHIKVKTFLFSFYVIFIFPWTHLSKTNVTLLNLCHQTLAKLISSFFGQVNKVIWAHKEVVENVDFQDVPLHWFGITPVKTLPSHSNR